jgi:hypothetical protein
MAMCHALICFKEMHQSLTTRHVIKKMTKDEKILILRSYISLPVKSDWDQLADNVYKIRDQYVSREMWKHYEDMEGLRASLMPDVQVRSQ